MQVWCKDPTTKQFCCYFSPTQGFTYTNTKDWLRNAEEMMGKNANSDVIWRKKEESARRMVWC